MHWIQKHPDHDKDLAVTKVYILSNGVYQVGSIPVNSTPSIVSMVNHECRTDSAGKP